MPLQVLTPESVVLRLTVAFVLAIVARIFLGGEHCLGLLPLSGRRSRSLGRLSQSAPVRFDVDGPNVIKRHRPGFPAGVYLSCPLSQLMA